MDIPIWLFIYVDSCLFLIFYLYVRKIKKRIGFQLGMNISMVMGGMIAMLSGVLFILQFPFHFTYITMLSALIGMGSGAVFGKLFDHETFVAGLTNGAVVGLMAPMIGTVVEMPGRFVLGLHILFAMSMVMILSSVIRS
ncbi:hypothetical protein [Sporosarcina luteola]|uniref:hypothetical protein n=1 Tax=Sporosarcina luteola TaxID=582850 RepID=UPI002041A31B|nr:hypothetical protein [Sporosarcina luteola]MCM3709094.1 hypothetical protein [Sporosarcina luteola]